MALYHLTLVEVLDMDIKFESLNIFSAIVFSLMLSSEVLKSYFEQVKERNKIIFDMGQNVWSYYQKNKNKLW